MRVCLIYCGIGVAGFNPCYPDPRPLGDREGSWIAHGLASIGASAKNSGFKVKLIDLRQLGGWDHFVSIIEADPHEVYGLSVTAVDYYAALKSVFEIKSRQPSAHVVVGGHHPTIFPEQYDFPSIDTVFRGEGEVGFVSLLKSLRDGTTPPSRVIVGEKPDLSKLPWVDRDLFDYSREMNCEFGPGQKTPVVTMLAGRGCQFKCGFCQPAENAVFGHPFRIRPVLDVVVELEYLKLKYDYRSITFWDDTFTFDKRWISQFCDAYEGARIGANIACQSRADIICKNEGMIERLASVGLDWIVIGLESGSQRLLDLMNKGTTVEQNLEAARICRKYGIKIFGSFMFGVPTETQDESRQTAAMIEEIAPEHPGLNWFTPMPGTQLYDYCDGNGLLLDATRENAAAMVRSFVPRIKGVDYDLIYELSIPYWKKWGTYCHDTA